MSSIPLGLRASIVLACIVLLSLAVRLIGVDRLLPHRPEPDPFVVLQLQELEGDPTKSWDTYYFERYPLLIARTLALWPDAALPVTIDAADRDDEGKVLRAHLAGASRPFLRVRLAVALCSGLLAPLTFFLARRFVSQRAALLAAFFVATSLLSMLYSQQGRPHGIAASLALGTVLAALRARERPSPGRVVLALLLAAATLASLQTGIFALPPLAVALFLAAGRPLWKRWPALAVPLAAALCALVFYANWPYIDAEGIHLAPRGGHTIAPSDWNGQGFVRGARLLWQHDPLLAYATGVGIVWALVELVRRRREIDSERRRDLAVVLSHALPYALVAGANGEIYERFLLPLLPYFALLSAAWIDALANAVAVRLRASAARATLIAAVYLAAVAFPGVAAFCFVRAALLADTQEQTAAWFLDNVPAQARILPSWGLCLPLLDDPETLSANMNDRSGRSVPWYLYQKLVPESDLRRFGRSLLQFPSELAFERQDAEPGAVERLLDELHVDYVAIEHAPRRLAWPMLEFFRVAAEARGDLVFSARGSVPDAAERGLLDFQAVDHLALRILETRAFGPGVDVYKIRR